jgi:hypothetical protein
VAALGVVRALALAELGVVVCPFIPMPHIIAIAHIIVTTVRLDDLPITITTKVAFSKRKPWAMAWRHETQRPSPIISAKRRELRR